MKEIIIIGIGFIGLVYLAFTCSEKINNATIEIRKEKEKKEKIEKIIVDDSICYKYKNSISCLKKEDANNGGTN